MYTRAQNMHLFAKFPAVSFAGSENLRSFVMPFSPVTGYSLHTYFALGRRSPLFTWVTRVGLNGEFWDRRPLGVPSRRLSKNTPFRPESAQAPKHSTGRARNLSSPSPVPAFEALLTLLGGSALSPLTDAEFVRSAVALTLRWCGKALTGRHASTVDLSRDFDHPLKLHNHTETK